MGVRNYRYATSDNAGSGETAKGEDPHFIVYQTAQGTAVTPVGGASVGSVKGPQESSMCIAAYAYSSVNSTGANGVTYDVEFYGGSTSSETAQLAALNGAVAQASSDGVNIDDITDYPFSSDVQAAAEQINQANAVPIICVINNTVAGS